MQKLIDGVTLLSPETLNQACAKYSTAIQLPASVSSLINAHVSTRINSSTATRPVSDVRSRRLATNGENFKQVAINQVINQLICAAAKGYKNVTKYFVSHSYHHARVVRSGSQVSALALQWTLVNNTSFITTICFSWLTFNLVLI
jgi:hypothetical protein